MESIYCLLLQFPEAPPNHPLGSHAIFVIVLFKILPQILYTECTPPVLLSHGSRVFATPFLEHVPEIQGVHDLKLNSCTRACHTAILEGMTIAF